MSNKPKLEQFNDIAIIQTAFLGDVALSLYFAEAVRAFAPESNIIFVTTPIASKMVKMSASVNEVLIFDKRKSQKGLAGIKSLSNQLKERHIDLVLSLHRSLRSTLISYFSKPKFSLGFNTSTFSFLYKSKAKYHFHLHEIQRNFELLTSFLDTQNYSPFSFTPNLIYSESDALFVQRLIQESSINLNEPIVLIAPGSVWATKCWGEENYRELVDLLHSEKLQTIIIGADAEKDLANRVANGKALNFAGRTSIPQTLELMRLSNVLITNDSSPTHFAGIVGCPAIVIFGPTSPIFGFSPIGENDIIIENKNLKCRPCEIHGSNKCPLDTHECMKSISALDIFKSLKQIVQ